MCCGVHCYFVRHFRTSSKLNIPSRFFSTSTQNHLKNLHMRLARRLVWYYRYFRFCAMPKKATWIFVRPQKIGQTSFVQISMWFFQFVFGVICLWNSQFEKQISSSLLVNWAHCEMIMSRSKWLLYLFRKKENKNKLHHIEVPEHDMISIEKSNTCIHFRWSVWWLWALFGFQWWKIEYHEFIPLFGFQQRKSLICVNWQNKRNAIDGYNRFGCFVKTTPTTQSIIISIEYFKQAKIWIFQIVFFLNGKWWFFSSW